MAFHPSAMNLYNKQMQYQAMYNQGGAGQKATAQNLAQQSGLSVNGNRYVNIKNPTPPPSVGDYISYKPIQYQTALLQKPASLTPQSLSVAPQPMAVDPNLQMAMVTKEVLGNQAPSNQKADVANLTQTMNINTALPTFDELTDIQVQSLNTQPKDVTKAVLTNAEAQKKADPLAKQKEQWQQLYVKGTSGQKKWALEQARKNGYTFNANGKLTTIDSLRDYYQNLINNSIASGDVNKASYYQKLAKQYGANVFIPYIAKEADAKDYLPKNYNELWSPEKIKKYADSQAAKYYNDALAGYMQTINRYQQYIKDLESEGVIRERAQKMAKMKYADAILQAKETLEDAALEYQQNIQNLEQEFAKNSDYVKKLTFEQSQRAKEEMAARGLLSSSVYDARRLNIDQNEANSLNELIQNKANNIARLDMQMANLKNQVNRQIGSLTKRQQDEAAMMYQELWREREKERKEYQRLMDEAYQNINRAKNQSNSMRDQLYREIFGEMQKLHEAREARRREEQLARERMAQEERLAREARAFQAAQAEKAYQRQLKLKKLEEQKLKNEQNKQFQNELKYMKSDFKDYLQSNQARKLIAKFGNDDALNRLLVDYAKKEGIRDTKYLDALYQDVLKNQNYWKSTPIKTIYNDVFNLMKNIGGYSSIFFDLFTSRGGSSSSKGGGLGRSNFGIFG